MSTFSALKKNSGSIEKLNKELEKINSGKNFGPDERYWKPELDKAGNGHALFRFLPAPQCDGEDALPWVRYFDHGFQGPTGQWYIENSRTSLGQNETDPVSELNSRLWAISSDDDSPTRKQARRQKRRLHYVSNILMIDDPKNPANNGKVFLFKYGKKIFDKVTEAMNPQFEDEKKINPFDFWTGANFKLRIRTVDRFPNYDKSEFDAPEALFGGDDKKLEALWKTEHSLKEILDPKNFKSYDELLKRLNKVLGVTDTQAAPVEKASAPKATKAPTVAEILANEPEEEEDDDLARFAKLAEDDD